MARVPSLAEAFRLLQRGRAAESAGIARQVARAEPRNARAHLALGIAQRMQGALPEARAALERASELAPDDYAAAFELGVALELSGDARNALACHEKAIALRPDFAAARFSAARLLAGAGRGDAALAWIEPALAADPANAFARHEKGWILHRSGDAPAAIPELRAAACAEPRRAEWRLDLAKALADAGDDRAAAAEYESLLAAMPDEARARVDYGRFRVSRGDFGRAAALFRSALELAPDDDALPIYLAQAELVQGRWREGWAAYARRGPRLAFQSARAARGLAYRLPPVDSLAGTPVTLLGEQGLGDALFYLRFAPRLAAAGARLRFRGDARLAAMLARSGLFESAAGGDATAEAGTPHAILVGDLPSLEGMEALPTAFAISPEPARLRLWRDRLAASGPRPWIGITWRAGTPAAVLEHGLSKNAPLDALCRAVGPLGGTVLALQRMPREGEIESASAALGARVHDLSSVNDDLEDALALVAILDRHVCVSNTNVHLAAAAGASLDVLVPFPPEWRWGAAGASPWFPSFRVHRQLPGGEWSHALAGIAR